MITVNQSYLDFQLASSLGPFAMTNAAEIIRYTDAAADISTFESMLTNVLYPSLQITSGVQYEANVGAGNTKALLAFGVFTENSEIYDLGISSYQSERCASVTALINEQGQNCESGRDQQHTILGIGNMAEGSQVAWLQGTDNLFGLPSNRLLTGYEYVADYNLGNNVTYDPSFQRCDANLLGRPFEVISASGRGNFRPVFELAYRHFVSEQNLSMPFTLQVINEAGTEGANSVNSPADSGG